MVCGPPLVNEPEENSFDVLVNEINNNLEVEEINPEEPMEVDEIEVEPIEICEYCGNEIQVFGWCCALASLGYF